MPTLAQSARCIRLTTALSGNGRLWEFGRMLRVPDDVDAEEAERLLRHRAAEVVEWRSPELETTTIGPAENTAERTRRPKGRSER